MDLLKAPNLGRKSLSEIKAVLSKHNLALGMPIPEWSVPNVANAENYID
jgi:DNA-directed RNA polymerase subunit alpha